MRSFHSLDGKHIAFADAFGLTRITLPNKARTERKLSAGLDAMLSGDATRAQLLAWRQGWDSMHHLSFPELKPLAKIPRFRLSQTVLSPDGKTYLEVRSHYSSEPSITACLWDSPTGCVAARNLAEADAPTRPGVALDGAVPGGVPSNMACAPAGVWAALRGPEPTLYVGDFSESPARLRWRAPVGIPRGAHVTLHPFDDGRVVLCAFVPRRREALLARFDAEGGASVTALPAIAPPAVLSYEAALHQTDEESVTRTSLTDKSAARIALPAAHAGPGRCMGEGSAMLFLPWHAEDVVDLRNGAVISRKLAAADAPVRRFFRERVRRFNALGMPAGLHAELLSLDAETGHMSFVFGWDMTRGDGSLMGFFAAGTLSALIDDDALRNVSGWRWAAGGGVSPVAPEVPWDEREVDAAFGTLESEGIPLMEVLQNLNDAYRFWDSAKPAPSACAFTRGGARRFLAGMVHAMTVPGAAGLREGARALDPRLDAGVVTAAMAALPPERGPRVGYHAMDLLVILSAHALGAEAAGVFTATERLTPSWRNGVGSLLQGAVRWLASTPSDRAAKGAS